MNIRRDAIKQSISRHSHLQNSGRKTLLPKCDNLWFNQSGSRWCFGFRNGSLLSPRKAERDFRLSSQRTISKPQVLEQAECDNFLNERHRMTKERDTFSAIRLPLQMDPLLSLRNNSSCGLPFSSRKKKRVAITAVTARKGIWRIQNRMNRCWHYNKDVEN